MNRANLPWRPVEPATLHWNEAGVPVSAMFDDVYYSRDNGLAESRHVFLQGNHLPHRWHTHPWPHFCIGELGFGTGLNFLLTWHAWRELPAPRPDLHYLAFEKHPLTHADLAAALATWPTLAPLAAALLAAYPGLLAGQHRVLLDEGRVRLDLWWEDATEALAELSDRAQHLVDAWYLDGFAPSRNGSMWTARLLQTVAALSRPGASLATFTVAGQVRRDLADAGFQVEKVPGHGRKRECLRASLTAPRTFPSSAQLSAWDIPATAAARPASALVVGGGLAGCTAAAALARRGIAVTLLEQGALAGAGSGNDQGILYTRLSRRHSTLVDFALQSFQFASSFYRDMFRSGRLTAALDGDLCGSFQQCDDDPDLATLGTALTGLETLVQVLDVARATEALGIAQPRPGYWYPGSGWLRPAAVCRSLVDSANIHVIEHCGTVTLRAADGQWQALAGGQTVAHAACAIVATGTEAAAMSQLQWLPLQRIRGQITHLPATRDFEGLRAALCHEGYIAPALAGKHSIGASFELGGSDTAPRTSDHRDNLARLAAAVPAWREALASLDPAALEGRVGFRCASPDYLPVVGPVPDAARLREDFAPLRKNARKIIATRGRYLPGLYVSSAHGSRGLTSTPIAAELLASMICAEPLPFSRALCRALAPARFIIRDLCSNRIQSCT